jgi:hypothetical protein
MPSGAKAIVFIRVKASELSTIQLNTQAQKS